MKTSWGISAIFSLTMALPSSGLADGSGDDNRAYCDQTCTALTNGTGHAVGVDGKSTWSASDDQWCNQQGLNAQGTPVALNTSTATAVSGVSGVSGVSAGSGPTDQANLQLCQQLQSIQAQNPSVPITIPAVCASPVATAPTLPVTDQRKLQCFYRNTQVLSHCIAYQAAHGATGQEKLLLDLDLAGTVTCGAACVMQGNPGMAPTAYKICKAASTAAAAAELISTLTMKTQGSGQLINDLVGGAGFMAGSKLAAGTKNAAGSYDNRGGSPCLVMGLFILSTATRNKNMQTENGIKANECQAINGLKSDANPITVAAVPPTNGTTGGSGAATTTTDCVANSGLAGCTTTKASAADTQFLANTGLDKALAPLAGQLGGNTSGGGSAGGMIGKAMSDAGLGSELADKAAQLAQTVDHSGTFEADSGAMRSAGGGGGGKGGADFNVETFGSALGGLGGDRAPASLTGNALSFHPQNLDPNDIWHQKSGLSIFEIVSHRLGKVKTRMDQELEYRLDPKVVEKASRAIQ